MGTNPCGQLPSTGPDGPTGVIVLKKIADDTYEQYGSIVLSTTGVTQVTISGSFDPGIGAIENTMTFREDFFSRVNLTATDSVWSYPSGAWGTQANALVAVATISGAVRLTGTGAVTGSIVFSRDEISTANKPTVNVNRNPTLWVGWAQFGTSAATRSIGWANEALASNSGSGLFWRHTNAGAITAVVKSAGVESTLVSSINAANGAYHYARMTIAGKGTAVQCILDGADLGTIAANVPTVDLMMTAGTSSVSANDGLDIDYFAMSENRVVST